MAEKKQDFVVSDRRRFAPEGDLRTDVPTSEEEKAVPVATTTPPTEPAAEASPVASEAAPPPAEAEASDDEMAPPTSEEQQAQNDAYRASGKKLEEMFTKSGGRRESLPEMSFERLVESFYMTALLQMGAIRQEGDPPAVDIIGARQTIDSLTILSEKTKGNLTEREQTLLQNVLFELRMAWIEITNALASAKPGAGPSPDRK